MIASLAVFTAGFIMRPIGAVIFGWLGDYSGRKIALTHTMLLMALPTFMIAVLPTYEQIGIASSILLVLCRLMQGICTGGEYNNAAIFLLEKTPIFKRGFYSGLMTASSILGFFLASMVAAFIDFFPTDFATWRIPFLFGASIGILGFLYRTRYLTESPEFQAQTISFSWFDIKQNKKNLLFIVILGWFAGTISLSLIGYIPSHLSNLTQLSIKETHLLSNFGIFIYMISLPILGMLSDKMGAETLMKIATFCTLILAYFIFILLESQKLSLIAVGVVLLALCGACFLGPMHAYFLTLFPASFRCRGISMSFSIGAGVLGGTAPLVFTFLIELTNDHKAPALYFILCAVITLYTLGGKNLPFSFASPKLFSKPHTLL